jgi:hypothetical protein
MIISALLVATVAASPPQPVLILERIGPVEDARVLDLRSVDKGERGTSSTCTTGDGTVVTLTLGKSATISLVQNGKTHTVVVDNVLGSRRPTLACGAGDDLYYANPRLGQVYAYSAARLRVGADPIVWKRQVEPFRSMDKADGVITEASVLTVIQMRHGMVLVEWFYRDKGTSQTWHEVIDRSTGDEVGRIGPSDLLLKTNDPDPWWVLFEGGGNDSVNYVPRDLYRLKYAPPAEGQRSAAETIASLRTEAPPPRKSAAKLSANPVVNHMVALLTPARTAADATVEFCPVYPAQRARYWLGPDYDDDIASVARDILLAFWAERSKAGAAESPIDSWFRNEVAPKEPMKGLLARFNPQDDRWIAAYQESLLAIGGPTFTRLFETYGVATGAVVRTPATPVRR